MARSWSRLPLAVVRPPHRQVVPEAAPLRIPVHDFFAPDVKSHAPSDPMQQIDLMLLEDLQLQQDEAGPTRRSEAVELALIIAVLMGLIGILMHVAMPSTMTVVASPPELDAETVTIGRLATP